MNTIYDALLRIQKLYDCKSLTDTAELLGMPKNTFYDNQKKAKIDYENIKNIETEKNPIKKKLLIKSINQAKHKNYSNALYHQFILLASKDNLNLNWIFKGEEPIHNNNAKIAKIVQNYNLKDYISSDTTAVPYFNTLNLNNENDILNISDNQKDYIILPTTMASGKSLYALKVESDSMSPNIKLNSVIIFDISKKDLCKACVYVLKYKNEICIKRVEDQENYILLRSDNIAYNTITADKNDVEIIGQVLKSISSDNIS
jgi:SOS-response transcriptional repressor LexA